VVHIKAVNFGIQELRDRLVEVSKHCGCELETNKVIKDTIIAVCKTENEFKRLEKIKHELEIEGKTIIISQQGL
jgi:hypothetical protein